MNRSTTPEHTRIPTPRAGFRSAAAAAVLLLMGLTAAACGSSNSEGASSATTSPPTTTAAVPTTAEAAVGQSPAAPAPPAPPVTAALAPWQTIEITDIDGVSFTMADFVGKSVFVENFATWCANCRRQLGATQGAAATVGDEAVVLALSVETDLSSEDVADYARQNGFSDVRFAVMSDELLAAFVDAFGTSAVNPPSTPHVFIAPDGAAGDMSTGSISEDEIVTTLRAPA